MILEAAITEVQQILGWRSDKAAEITLALKYAQDEREKPGLTFPWWLKTSATITTVAGTSAYSIPANFIQESEEDDGDLFSFPNTPATTVTVFTKKMSYKAAQEAFYGNWPNQDPPTNMTTPTGRPRAHVLLSTQIIFYPVPDKVYAVAWVYWGKDAAQTSGQENAWLKNAPWVLIGDAAKKIGADLGNANAVSTASGILSVAEANLFRSVIARNEAGRKRSMGSKL